MDSRLSGPDSSLSAARCRRRTSSCRHGWISSSSDDPLPDEWSATSIDDERRVGWLHGDALDVLNDREMKIIRAAPAGRRGRDAGSARHRARHFQGAGAPDRNPGAGEAARRAGARQSRHGRADAQPLRNSSGVGDDLAAASRHDRRRPAAMPFEDPEQFELASDPTHPRGECPVAFAGCAFMTRRTSGFSVRVRPAVMLRNESRTVLARVSRPAEPRGTAVRNRKTDCPDRTTVMSKSQMSAVARAGAAGMPLTVSERIVVASRPSTQPEAI